MNVSYRWLKQLLGIDLDWRDYVARVAGRGLAVEGVHERQAKPAGVISARVSGFRPHPSADSLWLADLDTGGGQVAVVTAATNLKTGDIVPWARPGARLADGREVGVAELRGVTSWGMVCSYAELGLDARLVAEYNREGIYRLPAGCPVGEDVSALLSLDDVILEFEIMPNRPDCFSVLGIARESAVILGTEFDQALFRPPVRPDAGGDGGWMVDIADANDCRRFSLALLTGVKVGDSPLWLQNRLQSLGVRPVNNVVDVTNYVMFVTGQPLHAYDCRKLPARRLGVRRGREGEKLVTLDGTERTLDSGVLVITSGQAVVGAAGIMGGLDSEVDGCTTEVALECAVFAPALIRRAGKVLGIRTDAAARFERGVDCFANPDNLALAVSLLQEICPSARLAGWQVAGPEPAGPEPVAVRPDQINQLLGMVVETAETGAILEGLGCRVDRTAGEQWLVTPPVWRRDLVCWQDLAEEVGRIYGYDRLVARVPRVALINPLEEDGRGGFLRLIGDILAAGGLYQTITYSFVGEGLLGRVYCQDGHSRPPLVALENPIVEEFAYLRNDLAANALHTALTNQNQRNNDLAIFELGRVFVPPPDGGWPLERHQLVILLKGDVEARSWLQRSRRADFFDIKGGGEDLLAGGGFAEPEFSRCRDNQLFHPGVAASIAIGNTAVGFVGRLHPLIEENFGFNGDVYLALLDVDQLWSDFRPKKVYRPIARTMTAGRDLSFTLDRGSTAAGIIAAVRAAGGEDLLAADIFDVYQGENVAAGKKSVAVGMTFATADVADSATGRIIRRLEEEFGAIIRR